MSITSYLWVFSKQRLLVFTHILPQPHLIYDMKFKVLNGFIAGRVQDFIKVTISWMLLFLSLLDW